VQWELLRPLVFVSHELGTQYVVPAGFLSDGTSVPRLLWWWEPPWGRAVRASILHDYLYYRIEIGTATLTRRQSDLVFHEALLAVGVDRITAKIMWAFVRLFGRSHIKPAKRADGGGK
jgi:hypothetical protein